MTKSQTTENNSRSQNEDNKPEVTTLLRKDDCNIQYGGISSPADDEPMIDPDTKDEGKCMKMYKTVITLTVEPVAFCFMFAFLMNMTCLTNLMMDKGCLYHLNYSAEICKNLSAYPSEKKEVEILATDFSLYSNIMGLIGAFFMIFIAPWSDKYGRKLPLIMAVLGTILTDVGLILCITNFSSRLEYMILSKVPSEIAGGFICVLTIIYSLSSEMSSENNRTLKYTVLGIFMGLGRALGGLTGGFLYRYYGYFYVYLTGATLHVFCFIWILFIIEETTGLDNKAKLSEKAKDFFVCSSFKKGISATFRKRDGNNRLLLVLLLLSMCVIVMTYESLGSMSYVYVHHIYNWDPTTYSMVSTTFQLASLVANIVLVPILIRVFKIGDYTLGIIGSTSMMLTNLIIAFAKNHTYIYYLGQLAGLFGILCMLSVQTAVSKLVAKDEMGKVFSFLATCEAVLPMLYTIAVTKLFEATLDIFPNILYTLSGVLVILPLSTFIFAFLSTKRAYKYLSVPAGNHVREKA